jgi:hypothetical protein
MAPKRALSGRFSLLLKRFAALQQRLVCVVQATVFHSLAGTGTFHETMTGRAGSGLRTSTAKGLTQCANISLRAP